MSEAAAAALERCVAAGGVAVFPADTVYGLACDPGNRGAVGRLYAIKQRPPSKAAAVMFLAVEEALASLPELGERTRAALRRLLPGPLTVLLPNPARRFPLACAGDPATVGLRVPRVALLTGVRGPLLQSSANHSGGPDPRRLCDVPEPIRAAVDLRIDGGELPGTPSTVVDLRGYEDGRSWRVLRRGAVGEDALARALGAQFHFNPSSYSEEIRAEVPSYDRLQDELTAASGVGVRRILDLGTGTGETAQRLLARHSRARLVGIDSSEEMLAAARAALPECVSFRVARLQDELPEGPFDLVASALCVHHLTDAEKADLFARVHDALGPGGRFVLADVVLPADPDDARTPLTAGFDRPSAAVDQLRWLARAGFDARVSWAEGDLAVLVADAPRA